MWNRTLDKSPLYPAAFWEPVFAASNSRVVFRSGGRICAFELADGKLQWCSVPGDHPVSVGTRLAYITDDNAIATLDAQSGMNLRTFRFHVSQKDTLPGARTFVWSISDRLIATSYARTDPGHAPYAVLSTFARLQWLGSDQSAIHAPPVGLDTRSVLMPQIGSGGLLVTPWRIIRLAPSPGFAASFWSATAYLGRRDGLVFAEPDPLAPPEERETAFRIRINDYDGRTRRDIVYRPQGLTYHEATCTGTCDGAAVAIDRQFVYGRLYDVLYRFPWDRPNVALSLGEATSFVGHSADGAMIITRNNGTWFIDARKSPVRSDRVSDQNIVLYHRTFGDEDVLGFANDVVVIVDRSHRLVVQQPRCRLSDAARFQALFLLACGTQDSRVQAVTTSR